MTIKVSNFLTAETVDALPVAELDFSVEDILVSCALNKAAAETYKSGHVENGEGRVEVVGSLGIAATHLATRPDSLHGLNSWMGISTNKRTYPDERVVEFARWAVENTGGFTLVVSDWLHRFNLALDHGYDWYEPYDDNKHYRELEKAADRRAEKLRGLFTENGIDARVALWTELLDEIGYFSGEEDAFAAGYGHQVMDAAAYDPSTEFYKDVNAIHKQLVPHLIERGVTRGNNETYVNAALSSYSIEEVFLTWLLAVTGRANIKIGPEWERLYDEVSAKYIGIGYGKTDEHAPFGAIYLRPTIYTPNNYARLMQHNTDPIVQTYMQKEEAFITSIPDIAERTIVDIGAGYGRLEPSLAAAARKVIAIELDPHMYKGLTDVAEGYSNVTALQGDALNLSSLLAESDVERPIFVIAQNTLGTFEGNPRALLSAIASYAKDRNGELVLSVLKQEALGSWGIPKFYNSLREMVGEADLEKSDISRGIFIGKRNDYRSKWWTDVEIEDFKDLGEVVSEEAATEFHIVRLRF